MLLFLKYFKNSIQLVNRNFMRLKSIKRETFETLKTVIKVRWVDSTFFLYDYINYHATDYDFEGIRLL